MTPRRPGDAARHPKDQNRGTRDRRTAAPGRLPDALDPDDLVAEARAGLPAPHSRRGGAPPPRPAALLVDIRPEAQRRRQGEIPGAVLIDRNVLEWRLAPRGEHRIPELRCADQTIVVVCSQGYASSLAAATLQRLGLRNATDLDGGFLAWEAAGLPAVPFGWHHPRIDRTAPMRHGELAEAGPADAQRLTRSRAGALPTALGAGTGSLGPPMKLSRSLATHGSR